jgi:proteasome lid subunit RPN8/RPN11
MFRFRSKRKEEPPQVDLLAEAEEAAFQAEAARKQARLAEIPQPSEEVSEAPSAEDLSVIWEEREDIYRPVVVDATERMRTLGLSSAPEIKAGQSVILLRRAACDALQEHLRRDLRVEQGGLLMGQVFHDVEHSNYLILIEQAIEAQAGVETAVRFEYTSATWEALMPQLQALPSDWTIVGSYHSHPDLGVFLSPTDLETQESIFAQDWQIALVVDPIRNETGFFLGRAGLPCLHWHILEG